MSTKDQISGIDASASSSVHPKWGAGSGPDGTEEPLSDVVGWTSSREEAVREIESCLARHISSTGGKYDDRLQDVLDHLAETGNDTLDGFDRNRHYDQAGEQLRGIIRDQGLRSHSFAAMALRVWQKS